MIDLFFDGDRNREFWQIDDEIRGRSQRVYVVTDRIACGGNAVTHKCVEKVSGEERAVKFQLRLHGKRAERFQQEIALLKRVSHAHLVQYVDHGSVAAKSGKGQIPFVVMELASSDLGTVIRNGARFSYESYIGQFRGLAQGLAALHAHAIHRDIKPHNILLMGERWAIADYGLCELSGKKAHLTRSGEVIGPKFWMSPEAATKACGCTEVIRKSSDVYQLVAVFWLVVTRRHPTGIVQLQDFSGPPGLFDLFSRCLAHAAGRRPQDGSALAKQLDLAVLGASPS